MAFRFPDDDDVPGGAELGGRIEMCFLSNLPVLGMLWKHTLSHL